jgi:hypothetical protein
MHTVKEADMFATKMDLLLKRLDEHVANKEAMKGTVKAMNSQMTCKVCGEVEHLGNNYPKTHEQASYMNNGSDSRTIMGGITNPTHMEVIRTSIPILIQINHP